MKKLTVTLVFFLVVYAIYNDLTVGTLPGANTQVTEAASAGQKEKKINSSIGIPFFEHTVKPGDTVLSVLDQYSKTPLEVSVTKAVEDFKSLNNGADPQKIKFGKTYKFPDYSKNN